MIDFQNRRAIVVDGHDAIMTYTTVQDLAAVVAEAVDLDGEWPVIGGVSGSRVTVSEILRIGEKVRGVSYASLTHRRTEFLTRDLQVDRLLLTRSNVRILRMEFSPLRGH